MRRLICGVFGLSLLLSGGIAMADPLADSSSDTPILPDPVPSKEVFPPDLATSGTAAISPALDSTSQLGGGNCSALSPCAVVTPALGAMATPASATVKKKPKLAQAQ